MSQDNVDDAKNNVVRKKRIIQEVVIKIEMSGGYVDDGESSNKGDENGENVDKSKDGKDGGNNAGDGSSNHNKDEEGGEGGSGEDGGTASGEESGKHSDGDNSEGGAVGTDHEDNINNQDDHYNQDSQLNPNSQDNQDSQDSQDNQDNQANQDNYDNQDLTSSEQKKCPQFAPCSEVIKDYNYGNDPTAQGGPKTQDQMNAEKAADKFLSVGPNLERCAPTTECDPDNNSILKYKSMCPEDEPQVINEEDLEYDENKLVRINWKKVKRYLRAACPSRKLKLLQALRLRLSSEKEDIQAKSVRDIVKHDLFDIKQLCCGRSLLDDLLWPQSVSLPHPVQNSAARLFNALVSQDTGRDYLKEVSIIQTLTWGRSLRSISEHSEHTTVDIHTGNMLISAMMKLSTIPFQRKDMVRKGLLKWLIIHFEDMEQQANSYHLEYASSLLMMMLTVPNSTEFVIDQTRQLLAFFMRILKVPGNTSWPYIRLAMLALFRNPKIASNAKQLNLPQILDAFLSQTNDKTEKQSITDVLEQLDDPASVSMEDIESQATGLAEDKLYLDEEINKGDPVNCLPDVGGEQLFKSKFACKKSKRKDSIQQNGSLVSQRSNNSLKKSPCQLKNCMKSKDDKNSKDQGSKSYNETTHTFDNVPNKNGIFPRTSQAKGNGDKTINGVTLPDTGKAVSTAGKVAPSAGKVAPTAGKVAPTAGKVAQTVGKVAPTAGTVAPTAGTVAPTAGKVAPTKGNAESGSNNAPTIVNAGPVPGKLAPVATGNAIPDDSKVGNGKAAPTNTNAGSGKAALNTVKAAPVIGKGTQPTAKGKAIPHGGTTVVQNIEIKQNVSDKSSKSQRKLLDDVRIGSGQSTQIYSDPMLNITATKITPSQTSRPGLNFNIRPLRDNDKNRTLKIVCNTDTQETDNFSCTVFELNGEDANAVVGTATVSTTQNKDGTINATVKQNINQ